jgi:hypothetical protein
VALPTIDTAFVKQYEAEVHEAYQRMGSKLRGTVRTKNGVVGASTYFQIMGKGTAVTKARNAEIAPMNLSHSNVECTLSDWYAGEWVDRLDELKINHDERGVATRAGAYALGRKTDELIIAQLDAGTQAVSGAGDLADSAGLTKAKIFDALETLNEADVPDDGRRYGVVSPAGWTDLMGLTEFTSSDYIGNDQPYRDAMGRETRVWNGVTWIRHSGLTLSTYRYCYIYHASAIGHAIGAEVMTDISWHGDRAAHFINNMMSQGAKLIDDTGIVRLKITE